MNDKLHPVQAVILKELLFHKGASFASLNKTELTSDHFTFHIKRLLKQNLVEKKKGKYFLTQTGKQFAGRLDIDDLKIEKFGAPSVTITCRKIIKGKEYFLVHQRLKEPFCGHFGFVGGKVKFGERTEEAASRELMEEAGLKGVPKLIFINHKLNGKNRNEIMLDNFFFLYLVRSPKGKLISTVEGKNYWKTVPEIHKLEVLPGFETLINALENSDKLTYLEQFVKLDRI